MLRGEDGGRKDRATHLSNETPPLLSFFSSDHEASLGIEEVRVVRGSSDGESVVEEGEAELSEPFGESKEVGGSVEVEGIRGGREDGSSEEGVLENSLNDLNGEG